MEFSDIELLLLFQVLHEKIMDLERSYRHYDVLIQRTGDPDKRYKYEHKFAQVISKYRTLDQIRLRVADEITLRELKK